MTEAELAVKIIDAFADFPIYKEVPAWGICDIVIDKGPVKVGIEVKSALNFDVIEQAYRNKGYFHYVYVAVPIKSRVHPVAERILKAWGIGLLGYNKRDRYRGVNDVDMVTEWIKPQLNRKPYKVKLHEYMMRSVAGSQNSRITAFGYFVERMTEVVRRNPGIGAKDLFERIDFKHYRTVSTFKSCVPEYIKSGVIKGIEYNEGKFYIKQTNGSN